MRVASIVVAATLAVAPLAARAQHGGAQEASARPPREAGQYDFLVGQWSLVVTPKVSGLVAAIHGVPKMRGTWKAWRALDGWGVEDELRIVDESGNPRALTHSLRTYDPASSRWLLAAVDAYRHRVTQAAATWSGAEMVSAGQGVDGDGKSYASRARISRVTPTSFRYQLDRSYDGGRTWDEAYLVIDATRTSAVAPR